MIQWRPPRQISNTQTAAINNNLIERLCTCVTSKIKRKGINEWPYSARRSTKSDKTKHSKNKIKLKRTKYTSQARNTMPNSLTSNIKRRSSTNGFLNADRSDRRRSPWGKVHGHPQGKLINHRSLVWISLASRSGLLSLQLREVLNYASLRISIRLITAVALWNPLRHPSQLNAQTQITSRQHLNSNRFSNRKVSRNSLGTAIRHSRTTWIKSVRPSNLAKDSWQASSRPRVKSNSKQQTTNFSKMKTKQCSNSLVTSPTSSKPSTSPTQTQGAKSKFLKMEANPNTKCSSRLAKTIFK
jgi:hypothetical protein